MVTPNLYYADLKDSYLFYHIAQKTGAYLEQNPGAHLYRLGIGDVSLPLCDAVIKALHEAVDDQATAGRFHGYMPECGAPFLREAIGGYLARPYMCSDEKAIALMGLQWHNSWPEFVHAFGMDEDLIAKWPDYQTALAASAEITPIITEVLANVTRDEAIEKLMTTDIPFDLCQHFADLQDDQQAWDAGFFQGIDYPSGKHIGIVKAPAIFSSGEAEFGPSGYPGEYTREVLKEYGFDDAKIDELREQGLVTEEDQWDKDQYNMEKLMAQAAAAKKKAE